MKALEILFSIFFVLSIISCTGSGIWVLVEWIKTGTEHTFNDNSLWALGISFCSGIFSFIIMSAVKTKINLNKIWYR